MDRTTVGAPGPTLTVTELLESTGPLGEPPSGRTRPADGPAQRMDPLSELTRSAGEDELHLKLAVVGDANKRI